MNRRCYTTAETTASNKSKTRSRFKIWVLEKPLGYLLIFDPYQVGAYCGDITRAIDKTWSLREMVILSLLDVLP